MKLDPEEQIIAAALDQAALDQANARGAGARIEFLREGYAKVTITISRELVTKAMTLDWSTGELFAEAVRISVPGALPIELIGKAPPYAAQAQLYQAEPYRGVLFVNRHFTKEIGMHSGLRVSELLTAHLCHELATPITAMLLAENAADHASTHRAASCLQFYRFAFGFDRRSSLAGLMPHELIAKVFADGRITCEYAEDVRRLSLEWQKLACNLLSVAADCLPHGGYLKVTAAPLRVEASGPEATLGAELYTALLWRPRITRITPDNVHAYFTGRLAEALGCRLEIISARDLITLGVSRSPDHLP